MRRYPELFAAAFANRPMLSYSRADRLPSFSASEIVNAAFILLNCAIYPDGVPQKMHVTKFNNFITSKKHWSMFKNYFTAIFSSKFTINWSLKTAPYLHSLLTYLLNLSIHAHTNSTAGIDISNGNEAKRLMCRRINNLISRLLLSVYRWTKIRKFVNMMKLSRETETFNFLARSAFLIWICSWLMIETKWQQMKRSTEGGLNRDQVGKI